MQDSSSKQQTKHKYKPNNQQTVLPPHSALSITGKKNTNKNSAPISPYMKLTQTTGQTLGGQTQKGRKNSKKRRKKGDLKHNKLKKNNEKTEK